MTATTPAEAMAEALNGMVRAEHTARGFNEEDGRIAIAALRAAGFAVVPVVATAEMLSAFNSYAQCIGDDVRGYAAMLAARPK